VVYRHDEEPTGGPGSARSFEELFAASYGRLVGLLFAFLHDQAQAEDAVQDAFASALLRWRVLRGYHDPEAWVRTVAFRRAIDHHRRSARQQRALLRLPVGTVKSRLARGRAALAHHLQAGVDAPDEESTNA
jgi:DNA-directed RNA polymerase specialized sigma24 family protein